MAELPKNETEELVGPTLPVEQRLFLAKKDEIASTYIIDLYERNVALQSSLTGEYSAFDDEKRNRKLQELVDSHRPKAAVEDIKTPEENVTKVSSPKYFSLFQRSNKKPMPAVENEQTNDHTPGSKKK